MLQSKSDEQEDIDKIKKNNIKTNNAGVHGTTSNANKSPKLLQPDVLSLTHDHLIMEEDVKSSRIAVGSGNCVPDYMNLNSSAVVGSTNTINNNKTKNFMRA